MQCQPHEGAIIWDLKPVDNNKSIDYIGKGQEGFGGHTFAVELCEMSFPIATMPSYTTGTKDSAVTYTVDQSTIAQGNAYWTTETSGDTNTFTPE